MFSICILCDYCVFCISLDVRVFTGDHILLTGDNQQYSTALQLTSLISNRDIVFCVKIAYNLTHESSWFCRYPNFETSHKFAFEIFSCWNGPIAKYHTRDQRHHDVWHTIMMKIIQMKKLTANPQKRRQDEWTGYILEVTDLPLPSDISETLWQMKA